MKQGVAPRPRQGRSRFEKQTKGGASGELPKLLREMLPAAVHQFAAGLAAESLALLIDGHCNVLWSTPHGERLLRSPMPLFVGSGKLHTGGTANARTWASFVENLGHECERLLLNGDDADTWVLLRGWAEFHGEHRFIFLRCAVSCPLRDVASSGLAEDFGLTRSECAVLDEFARLLKPNMIAERLSISVSTVRSHLKQIHTKMAVSSSTQLLNVTRAYTDK